MPINVRAVLGLINAAAEALSDGGNGSLTVDRAGALWARDYQAQPAQTWTPITPGATAFAAASPPIAFRALRFDIAGTVTFNTPSSTGLVRNVAAGELWSASSNAILAITAVGAGVVVDGLG